MTIDPVELSRDLIRCASVTPADDGAIPMLENLLGEAGFTCLRADRGGVVNLIARWGERGAEKTLGFNGHTDVVPAGAIENWTHGPFAAVVEDGILWGRGATDMKTAVAAFVAAAVNLVESAPPDGAILITVTGDEEGPGLDGTRAILDRMAEDGERMSVCLVGEPTCPHTLGEMMKIGRRGSMTAYIEAEGVQGHAAYPHLAKNPVSALARLMDRIASHRLDAGTEHFDPSTVAVTGFDTGNTANNVIPATSRAMVNIRFNDAHSSATISDWIRAEAQAVFEETGVGFDVDIKVSGESFLTPPGPFSDMVADAVEAETGIRPEMSTSGGTSDARFIKDHCPVVEFGLVGQTMHQVDERIEVAQVTALTAIYSRILKAYFA